MIFTDHDSERRSFLKSALAVAAGVISGTHLSGCATVAVYRGRVVDGRVSVPLSTAQKLSEGLGAFVIRAPNLAEGIILLRSSGGEYTAIGTRCTHLGCTVRPGKFSLICPCHGSSFDFEGNVLRGPAQRPLRRYRVNLEGDQLQVLL